MVDARYKENETLISGEGEREEKIRRKNKESTGTAKLPLSILGLSTNCRSASHE